MSSSTQDEVHDPYRDIPSLTDDETDVESQDRNLHIRSPSETSDRASAIPVWMRESAKTFKYKWVPLPMRKAGRATAKWIKGPVPPIELHVKPFFPTIQEAPIKLMDRYVPKKRHRAALLVLFYACWFLTWSLMLRHNSTSGYIKGYGKPANLWCGATFWCAFSLPMRDSTYTSAGILTMAVALMATIVVPSRPRTWHSDVQQIANL